MAQSMNPPASSTQTPNEMTETKDKKGNTILSAKVKTNKFQAFVQDVIPSGLSKEESQAAWYYFLAYVHTLKDPNLAASILEKGVLRDPGFEHPALKNMTTSQRVGYLMGVQDALDADPVFQTLEAMGALKAVTPTGSTSTPSNSPPSPGPMLP